MPDKIDFFVRVFYLGGIITTSLYCFFTYLSRGRDRLFLGYGLFTLAASLLFFARRMLPLFLADDGNPWPDILSHVFIDCVVAGGLYYFLVFFGIDRKQRAFGFFIKSYLLVPLGMIVSLVLFLAGFGKTPFMFHYIVVGAFTSTGLVYVIRVLIKRGAAFRLDKRILVYLGCVFLFLIILSFINVFIPLITFSFVIPGLYTLLIFFFFLHGRKLNRDYRELFELKMELEEKVRLRTAQVEDLHRKKQRFFITFTHETKTPLTLVASCLERYMASAPAHPDLDLMQRNLAKLRVAMGNYLDFEKLLADVGHFDHDQTTDLSLLLREKSALFQPLAQKKAISLTGELDERVCVAADPAALDQIINNLLDNAVKYTEPGGRIGITLRKKGASVVFSVRDSGLGISPEQQEHVFDPFYQISHKGSNVQGIGMGLSIVREIVAGLGGKIVIKSRPPAEKAKKTGPWVTEIEVSVPGLRTGRNRAAAPGRTFVASEPLDTLVPAETEPSSPRAGHDPDLPTVLFVEDNRELLRFLMSSLSERFNAYGASDGREALDRIETLPRPDVIVSDIMMEGMDGYAFFAALKQLPPFRDVPFIFLTAVSSPLEKIKSLSDGAVDFITKPLAGAAELEAKIVSLLDLLKRRTEQVKGEVIDKLRLAIAEESTNLPRQENLLQDNMTAFGLTDREQCIVACLREGLQNKEISARLGTSTRTVDNHLYNIFRKTGSQNRMDLLNRLLVPRTKP